ncbi:CASP-like protein 5B2 isoform X1 [Oryza brachyantha]|uniref:CASP-like protein n=1 Tax=Oryza brachyantha TaxID=4533 RepID=J3M7T9_ORYBR|nr:CASP-like protein 5B2 isoform X1 [Oryza brachyantha]
MWEVAWRPGTWGGLAMRVGQVAFAGASIGVMASGTGFANYTAFCYLIASMGLQSLWSLGLACLDVYALTVKRDLNNALLVSLFVIGDWVTALLSFAASCSAGGVMVLFKRDVLFCRRYPQLPCGRFELAVALAFLSWALSATSAIIMFCLLAAF